MKKLLLSALCGLCTLPLHAQDKSWHLEGGFAVTDPKLKESNLEIQGVANKVKAVAPNSGNYETWNDRSTGYSYINILKKCTPRWGFGLTSTYSKGSVDSSTTGVINTTDATYSPLNGASLQSQFEQTYTTMTIGLQGRYFSRKFPKLWNTSFQWSHSVIFMDFESETTARQQVQVANLNVNEVTTYSDSNIYYATSLAWNKQLNHGRRDWNIGSFIEYIPSNKMSGSASGTSTTTSPAGSVATPTLYQTTIDLSSDGPSFGLYVSCQF